MSQAERVPIVRRWMLAPNFVSGAIIVETSFARRVSGSYGATKLSLSLAPFLDLGIAAGVRSAEFTPAPNVPTVILTSTHRVSPRVSRHDARAYWSFVNYLFERGSRTVGESLRPLVQPGRLSPAAAMPVGEIDVTTAIELFETQVRRNSRTTRRIQAFEAQLPAGRRSTDLFEASLQPRPASA